MVSVVVLLGLVLGLLAAGVAQLRSTDAARAGARAAALGQDNAAITLVVRRCAGGAARVSVARADGWVDVTVALPVLGGVPFGNLTARATAGLPVEP